MELKTALLNPYYKHINQKSEKNLWQQQNLEITAAKGAKFGFLILLKGDEDFLCSLDENNNICQRGLINNIRVKIHPRGLDISRVAEIYKDAGFSKWEKLNLFSAPVGYTKDDNGDLVADPILRDISLFIEKQQERMLWVQGEVPRDFAEKEFTIDIDFYHTKGYEEEKKIHERTVQVKVMDIEIKPLKEGEFFLDLWQHTDSLARQYKVPLWSQDHFIIIRNYIRELSSLGAKTITAVVSDYPWAGQDCYNLGGNTNLFQTNMVKIIKDKEGKIRLDFANLDRYIKLCMEEGISAEIDLFGLLGNWAAMDFGNPLEEYKDPIRLRYYNEAKGVYAYINSKEDLAQYIKALFNHLIEMGWWEKVRVISDEPNNPQVTKGCMDFMQNLVSKEVYYKAAFHQAPVLEQYGKTFKDLSLGLPLLVDKLKDLEEIKHSINEKGGKTTYYVCCFPERPNTFLCSPLVESRIIPLYAYYFGIDGFLRWAYALWTENPMESLSYKFPRWKAGDMCFLYPGHDLKPLSSLRWENLRFGIQDYALLKELEKKHMSPEEIREKLLKPILGSKESMKSSSYREVTVEYCEDYDEVINRIKF